MINAPMQHLRKTVSVKIVRLLVSIAPISLQIVLHVFPRNF
jgi:hypothetical protein